MFYYGIYQAYQERIKQTYTTFVAKTIISTSNISHTRKHKKPMMNNNYAGIIAAFFYAMKFIK